MNLVQHCERCGALVSDVGQVLCGACWKPARSFYGVYGTFGKDTNMPWTSVPRLKLKADSYPVPKLVGRARNPIRNMIPPEYREELIETGVIVPLDVHPVFRADLDANLDALERSPDHVVAFAVATGRFSNETSAVLVLPDLETAARVRSAAYAASFGQTEGRRIMALELANLIERATKIASVFPSPYDERSTSIVRRRTAKGHSLLARPTATSRRRGMRLLTDAHGERMRGVIGKFPKIFQQGYAVGWEEYESDEEGSGEEDRWGQHIRGLEEGLFRFAAFLEKAGFETLVHDVCGCGDPLHLAVCFHGNGATLAVRIWDGIWRDDGSSDLKEDLCFSIAEGDETIPDDSWEVIDLLMSEEEWAELMESGFVDNPPRSGCPRRV